MVCNAFAVQGGPAVDSALAKIRAARYGNAAGYSIDEQLLVPVVSVFLAWALLCRVTYLVWNGYDAPACVLPRGCLLGNNSY